ncbi:FAD-binding domain-containing protein [Aaosphaeria arxii CBS 175.79]|uniref:Delta(24)-sterol reductase n=1 Tax=Aaosphaeria arxii CBS 175.79 TaxID=1450172 RepID=A0A6A5Y720_9PLEO|nr:FAD-binding domain-containing protein [Aaosphaeria arxii CBS 175.79]KAF2020354.1 FAD-binding domain-containing protein [Aaosphaeria arxii CBS 175.79]
MMDGRHGRDVEQIRSSISHFYQSKTPFRVYHGSTNSTRHANFQRDAIVDVSSLNHVLHIDVERKTALVEPNVPMDELVQATKRVGLLPPVVMEFPGITVGGGFVGTAGESSSFKHGFFDRTILSAEVILADGRLVTASETSNRDLFHGLRGSFGTLGILTLVELRLIDLKKYVQVTYHPTNSFDSALGKLREETKQAGNEFVDGILFSRTAGVIISGVLTNSPSHQYTVQRFSRPWDPWFYLHAEHIANQNATHIELVPIEDYLFRCDRGAFWMGRYAFKFFMMPWNWFFRLILDYFMHTRIMYHAMHASGHTDKYIIQDIAIPSENTLEFIEFVDSQFGIYPLWLCPLRNDARSSMGHPKVYYSKFDKSEYQGDYVNVGVWAFRPLSEAAYVKANRDLEGKVGELGGLKWLYARIFFTEDEFWKIYDERSYTELRRTWNAMSLPSIWEKMRERPRMQRKEHQSGLRGHVKGFVMRNGFLSGVYGVYKALRGGDYMLAKKN